MRYRIPSRLGHVIVDGARSDAPTVFLMPLPDGPPLVLRDSAALIWIVAGEGYSNVPTMVAHAVGRPAGEVAEEVEGYLRELVDRGLLEVSESRATAPVVAPDTPV